LFLRRQFARLSDCFVEQLGHGAQYSSKYDPYRARGCAQGLTAEYTEASSIMDTGR
jgi:predicted transcriptional regulator with HTH domain